MPIINVSIKKKWLGNNIQTEVWQNRNLHKYLSCWTEETQINTLLIKDFTSLHAYMCTAILKGDNDCIHTCMNYANNERSNNAHVY